MFLDLYFTGCWLDIGPQECTRGGVSWPLFQRLLTLDIGQHEFARVGVSWPKFHRLMWYWPAEIYKRWCFLTYISKAADFGYWPAGIYKGWCFLTYISQAADWILASRNTQEVVFLDLYFTGCWLDIGQQECTRGGVSWPIFQRLLTLDIGQQEYTRDGVSWPIFHRLLTLDIGQQEYTRGGVSWPIFHRLLTGHRPAGIYKIWCFLTYISQAADWILASRNIQKAWRYYLFFKVFWLWPFLV